MASAGAPKHRHVVPNPGRGWVVVRAAADARSMIEPEQAEAVHFARRVARRQDRAKLGKFIFHRPDGRIEAGESEVRGDRRYAPLAATRGAATIFDFLGVMHPGVRPAGDPWTAAADDVADAWRTVGDLIDESLHDFQDELNAEPRASVT